MATAPNSRRRTSASSKTKNSKAAAAPRKSGTAAAKRQSSSKRSSQAPEESFLPVVLLFVVFCVLVILSLCMFGVIKGSFGPFVRDLLLGLFGLLAYVLPLVFIGYMFYQLFIAEGKTPGTKIAGFILVLVFLGMFLAFLGTDLEAIAAQLKYEDTFFDKLAFVNKKLYADRSGGGVILGIPALIFHGLFGKGGGLFVIILFIIFSFLLIGGKGFFDNMMEIIAGQRQTKRIRREEFYDDEEWSEEEEAARLEEEARLAREERRRKHIEAARKKARHEEDARIASEEKERLKEERRVKKQENERLRKEAEERAEDERILRTSNPGRRRLNQAAFEMGVPGKHKLDDIHEITLLDKTEALTGADAGFADENSSAANDTKRIYDDELRELTFSAGNNGTDAAASEVKPEKNKEAEIKNDTLDIKIKPYDAAENKPESEPVKEEKSVQEELPLKPKPSFFEEEDESVNEQSSKLQPSESRSVNEQVNKDSVNKDQTAKEQITKDQNVKDPAAKESTPAADTNKPALPYEKPPISLLKDPKKSGKKDTEADLKETALLLQQTLKSFGVVATVNDISQGPSVTRFELQLGEGIKVNKIVNLADDLKLNLAAEEIRIEAPIPGKAAVGIEIPNKERIAVSLKELIESAEFKKASSKLTFVVGKDISGHVIVGDIGKMPHLLVAGTTGSGKSVFTNSIIQSILFNADPDEVKLILIDPKVVEFSVYNGIPHLLMPVVTEPRKANVALAWAVAEMSRRYKLFAEHDVRGIDAYNEQVERGKVFEDDGSVAKKLPKIVIVVDELADLMMVAGKEVEDSICRLAQLARAAGIHLIIATQRPSVDVITGLIKANMPSRVALKCGSGVDSRTILDATGAEKLLGYGDMLFSPQGYNKPLRVQGAFVSDEEVQQVAEFLKSRTQPQEVYDQKILDEVSNLSEAPAASSDEQGGEGESGDGLDEYFEKACRFVIEKEKASSGMLQRVFKIGFNRAARIIDQMEANGIVGPEEGTKPRKVLMSMQQLEEFLKSR